MVVRRASGTAGETPTERQGQPIQTGYGPPTTGGAFSSDPTKAGGGGGMPGAYKPDPNKPGRNVPGENSAFKPADPWSEMSPENQVGFESAVDRGKKIREADIERQKGYPKFDGVDEKGNPISWDELDKQYMPDEKTVANPANTEFENDTAFNPEYSMPESKLMAFNNTGGSSAAMATSEAGLSADSATGALGEGASSMVSGGSGDGGSSSGGEAG